MSSRISVKGSLYVQDAEDGKNTNNIPFEIYSDYSGNPTNTYFRQLHISNVFYTSTTSMFMGISNVGTYFYMSEPSEGSGMTEQSNTFVMTTDGIIGIGKTNPHTADRLHVEGDVLVRGSAEYNKDASVSDNIYASNVMMGDQKLVVDGDTNHRIPSGTIALWEDASNIPNGWVLFNALGTKFVRGSNTAGTFSGSNSVILGNVNFPKHTHTTNSVKYATNPHIHNNAFSVVAQNANHSHSVPISIDGANYSHQHFFPNPGNTVLIKFTHFLSSYYDYYSSSANYNHNSYGDNIGHNHNYKNFGHALGNKTPGHGHNINTTIGNSGWGHPAINTANTNANTNDNTYATIPKYKSYVFIIKE